MSKGEITYNQQIAFCGKSRCRKCREGIGHGPYWYAYKTVNGRTTRTYIGKTLPPHIQPREDKEGDQTRLRTWLLGPFRMQRRTASHHSWQTIPDTAWSTHPSARSLLAYLISRPNRQATRQSIQQALWPHISPEEASTQLERATTAIHQVIESSRSRRQSLLRCETAQLTLADHNTLWSDVDAFDALFAKGHAATENAPSDPTCQIAHYEEMLALYKGDFLPEEREEWANLYRQTLRLRYTNAVLALADLYIAQKRLNHAIDLLDDLLANNPANEAAVQRLMIALAHMMRRGEAQRLYQRFTDMLQREHATIPSQETLLLYDVLQQGGTLPVPSTLSQLSQQQQQQSSPSPQIGRAHHTSLVGREQEWTRMQALLQHTEQSPHRSDETYPHIVVLLGEAGIGKTRMAEELAREMQPKRWTVIWDQAYPQERSIPYRPWIEIFRQTLARGIWQREMVSQRPLLFQSLAPLLPEINSSQMSFAPLPSEHEQLRLWEAARELLTLISEHTPCLIVLDDLHWADSRSCELLAYLARHLQGSPIAIIATCRDNEWQANHHLRTLLIDLQREHAVETIHLHPLDNENMTALVSQLLNHSLSLVEHVRERARGNPFFAEELAHSIEARRNATKTAFLSDLASMQLPETITALLDQRLSQLSQPCQKLLSTAAVLGYTFPLQRLNAMEGATQSDHLLDLLEEAVHASILTEEGAGSRIAYSFWHPLFQSYLYERLSAVRRARLHYRTALMLQRLYQEQPEEEAATIAQHLISGGAEPQHIAHYATLAGHRAYRLSAYTEAEQQYQIALDHLDLIARPDQAAQQCLYWTLIGLGECKRIQGNAQKARSLYERVLTLSEQMQDLQMLALLWCEIGLTWYDAQQLARAQQCYQHGEQVLKDGDIEHGPGLARLRYEQGYASWRQGDYEQARKQANEALHLFEAMLAQEPIQQNLLPPLRLSRTLRGDAVDIGRTHMLIGLIENSAGHSKKTLDHLRNTLTYFEQHNCLRELAITCCNLGDLHLRRTELASAQLVLRRGLHLAEQMGDTPLRAYILGNLGILHLRLGSLVEAETHCKHALALCEQVQDEIAIGQWTVYAAFALQEQGKLAEAARLLRRALQQAHALQLPHFTSLTFVALAGLRLRQALQAQEQYPPAHQPQLLAHKARQAAQKALQQEGLEAETHTEGLLTLAHALLLLGDIDQAQITANRAQQEARAAGLRGLSAQTLSLFSTISAQQGATIEAEQYSAQASSQLHTLGMQLEYARALYQQGCLLLQKGQSAPQSPCYQRGLAKLQEARQAFLECHAIFDEMLAARRLHATSTRSTRQSAFTAIDSTE
jgi:DNA-binding SARP family transcriptional activator